MVATKGEGRLAIAGGAGFGVDLTTVASTGSGTVLPVADAGVFKERIYAPNIGVEYYAGDEITFNGQTRTVIDRNLTTNELTLSVAATWTSGDPVNLANYTAGYTGLPPAV